MLTELKLTNFRIFNDEVTVRFRPITVLIGRNSSGKSSIIKFLLMLQQSSTSGRSQFLTADGERVSLGAFPELKNTLTRKRNLRFEFTTNNPVGLPDPPLLFYLDAERNVKYNDVLYRAAGDVTYSSKVSKASSRFSLSNQSTAKEYFSFKSNTVEGTTFWDVPPVPELQEFFSELHQRDELHQLNSEQLNRQGELVNAMFARGELISAIRYHINSLRHLSPVRAEAQRVILASYPAYDNVGQRGEYALPHLQLIANEDKEKYEFILPHLRNVAGVEGVVFKTSSGYVSRAIARTMMTGAEVLIADLGFGVSQCLPIFVQGAIMAPFTTLMVEQPEAQLHPTAQLELGEYFADLWKHRNVASIIETHSDNILLRLRRLIAKGELSHEDVSVAYFTFDETNHNMPMIKNLDINEDGSMQAGLPMEFFGADIIEGLNLGAKT